VGRLTRARRSKGPPRSGLPPQWAHARLGDRAGLGLREPQRGVEEAQPHPYSCKGSAVVGSHVGRGAQQSSVYYAPSEPHAACDFSGLSGPSARTSDPHLMLRDGLCRTQADEWGFSLTARRTVPLTRPAHFCGARSAEYILSAPRRAQFARCMSGKTSTSRASAAPLIATFATTLPLRASRRVLVSGT